MREASNICPPLLIGRTALQAAEMQDPDAATFLRKLRQVGTVWMLVGISIYCPPCHRHAFQPSYFDMNNTLRCGSCPTCWPFLAW